MKTVRILLEIQMNSDGAVKSSHRPLSGADRDEMESWPSGGLVHVAHAFFIETLRRESYTMALTQLSTGTKPEELTAKDLEKLVRSHLIEMADKFAPSAAEEAVQMLSTSA